MGSWCPFSTVKIKKCYPLAIEKLFNTDILSIWEFPQLRKQYPFGLKGQGGKTVAARLSCITTMGIPVLKSSLTHLPRTKWPPFGRWYFQTHFANEKYCILIKFSLGLDNGLALKRWQAIIWTNADLIHWRINAALGGDKLNSLRPMTFNSLNPPRW